MMGNNNFFGSIYTSGTGVRMIYYLYESVELGDAFEGEFVHKINLIRVTQVFLHEGLD